MQLLYIPWNGQSVELLLMIPGQVHQHLANNYMDCVVIKTVNESNDFTWEIPTRSEEPEYRPVAEHFTFNDDIDYLPVYVEFDEEIFPRKWQSM